MAKKVFISIMFIYLVFISSCSTNNEYKNDNKEVDINTNKNMSVKKEDTSKVLPKPEMMIDVNKSYKAVLDTSEGKITIELNVKDTPITSNNFVYLSRNDFYDGIIFHRVIEHFMIQAGCPKGNGTGNPGYQFDDEEFEGEYTRGTVAMANSGPDTNGSQFFIMHKENPLPKDYVIFGKVIDGLDIVDKIATAETTYNSAGEKSKPINPVTIEDVEIIEE